MEQQEFILFFDGEKKQFISMSIEEIKNRMCPEDFYFKGLVLTHKKHMEELDTIIFVSTDTTK